MVGLPAMVVFESSWLAILLALNAGGASGDVWMAPTLVEYLASVTLVDTTTGL